MAVEWKRLVYASELTQYLLVSGLVLPFYIAAGTLDTIPLTADRKIPFFKADGNPSNIPLTT